MHGSLTTHHFGSTALTGPLEYDVYTPPSGQDRRLPVAYLLHGRGGSSASWGEAVAHLDELVSAGRLPPFLAVLPDAPWLERASFYVDSRYRAGSSRGAAVETALTRDLVVHVDASLPTIASPAGRLIGGYSMGGAGALRYVVVHRSVFGAAIVVAPAVYHPLPPSGSSSRQFGAFGVGERVFDPDRYRELSYIAHLTDAPSPTGTPPGRPTPVFVAVGEDDLGVDPSAHGPDHTLRREAERVADRLGACREFDVTWRVYPGGHDWTAWTPAVTDGLAGWLTRMPGPGDGEE